MMTILTALSSIVVLGVCSWFGYSIIRGQNDKTSDNPVTQNDASPSVPDGRFTNNDEAMTEVHVVRPGVTTYSTVTRSPMSTLTTPQIVPPVIIPGTPLSEVNPSPITGKLY